MVSPGEISLLCRLCLVKDQVNVPIFGEQGDIRQIFLKISSCLPVTVSKEDQLPKNICEGCSDKLDLLFAFWNSSRDAEKTLVSWLKQASVDNANETINAIAKQISAKPVAEVKQETDDGQNIKIQQSSEEGKNDESEEAPPPPKRARRTAAVKAQISISQEDESEEEEDDVDAVEPLTKVEDESDMSDNDGADNQPLSSFVDMPGTSADDQEQAGPSGVGKDGGADAPSSKVAMNKNSPGFNKFIHALYCNQCGSKCNSVGQLQDHFLSSKNHSFECPNCHEALGNSLMQVILHTRKVCSREKFMEAESKLNDNEVRYYCERCSHGFSALAHLLKHYLDDHKDQVLCCSRCDKQTTNFLELYSHYTKTHKANEPPKRLQLPKRAPAPAANKEDIPEGSKAQDHKDTELPAAAAMSKVKIISNLVLSPARPPVASPSPEISSKTITELDSEAFPASSITPNAKPPKTIITSFYCNKCGKKFISFKELCHHIFKSGDHLFRCANCDFAGGKTLANIVFHTKVCSRQEFQKSEEKLARANPSAIRYYCERCGKGFATLDKLMVHYPNHQDQKLKCSECEKITHTFTELLSHYRNHESYEKVEENPQHAEEVRVEPAAPPPPPPKATKPLFTSFGGLKMAQPTCDQCGQTFFSIFSLDEHAKSHVMGKVLESMSRRDNEYTAPESQRPDPWISQPRANESQPRATSTFRNDTQFSSDSHEPDPWIAQKPEHVTDHWSSPYDDGVKAYPENRTQYLNFVPPPPPPPPSSLFPDLFPVESGNRPGFFPGDSGGSSVYADRPFLPSRGVNHFVNEPQGRANFSGRGRRSRQFRGREYY